MNERTLLRLLRDGDTAALGEIIGQYTPYLYAVAANILGHALPQEDIEEVVSDSFVSLWTHRQNVAPGKLKPWLAAVCRNRAKDALRARKLAEPLDDDLLEVAAEGDMEQGVLRAAHGAGSRGRRLARRAGRRDLPAALLPVSEDRGDRRRARHERRHGTDEARAGPGAPARLFQRKGVWLCRSESLI